MSNEQVYAWLLGMHDYSIYDSYRLAQPDEVVNYKTGDGLEKAFVLANIAEKRTPENESIRIESADRKVLITAGNVYCFSTSKGFEKTVIIHPHGKRVVT